MGPFESCQAGEMTDAEDQKNDSAHHITDQHKPVIVGAVDHPLRGGERDVSGSHVRQYIPPIPPAPAAGMSLVFSGISDTSASVVSIREAMDAAF